MARRIVVSEFRGEDIEIEFVVDGKPVVYPIRGDILIDPLLLMLDLERESGELSEEQKEGAAEEFVEWLEKARKTVADLVYEKTPDAKLPLLSVQECMGIFGALAGGGVGESVSKAVAEALQAGTTPEELEELRRRGDGPDDPLRGKAELRTIPGKRSASPKRSSSRSAA